MEADLDPFDTVLSLEDEYYAEGHALGVKDGSRAGRIEGRVFGLEKGFEKFVAMGALHAKAAVWAARLPAYQQQGDAQKSKASADTETGTALPALPENPRLAKHVATLHALSEPASLSTQNDEDAVSEFDDRLKRAQAKVKVIEKLVNEGQDVSELTGEEKGSEVAASAPSGRSSSAAGAVKGPKRIGGGVKMVRKEGRGEEKNMEDFGTIGSRQS
ncbi:hypothetical protein SLS56_006088 [Neofusicoccum ribis]|uniref:Essential protein Yae1 N-terminal domain-containing protein n=1 Tax=Neofusicoccum ribis TaxID=45134 RepID=A0ABR3SRS8_9PEZI